MYYTSSGTGSYGAYRKSKMVIDGLNVILAVIIVALFVALIFLHNHRSILFPMIFLAGGVDNAVAAAKGFMNYNRIGGIILSVIAILLLLLALISFEVR